MRRKESATKAMDGSSEGSVSTRAFGSPGPARTSSPVGLAVRRLDLAEGTVDLGQIDLDVEPLGFGLGRSLKHRERPLSERPRPGGPPSVT